MSDHDDFAFDVAPGIPAPLPKGEEVLWQGRPDTSALAREAFKIRWIAAYMALIVLWKAGAGFADGGLALALLRGLPYVVLALAAVAVVWLLAWAQARATVYTVTSARVLMKIGAALSVTYNIPFAQVATARLDLKPKGTGTIALETLGETRLAFLALWPHLRPGRLKKTEPALRCIPDAERVARLLAEAAEARLAMPVISRIDAAMGDAVAAE
ncbi:hypothetical protein C0V75_10755 [Tabrizicola sp. TH137]|uniref:photosynthetic complex putative assembly protein PuhB n=1 Tax=Tabrizicola sp. TH137 TaxID=2067452 RepID=UPI000C79F136|nr:photosynthetic complex putative assembly protein PuhB [Tabrizicola sp. TH137]PLL12427.1 hypothetical protein C0V75_10755 [Tabrizicola sp. TH137]